jgi:hypothetical protein
MLLGNSEAVEYRQTSRLAARFHIQLRSDAPDEFGLVAFRRKHPAEKQQIPGLHCLRIDAEWLRPNLYSFV